MSSTPAESKKPTTVKIQIDENIEHVIAANFPYNFNVGNLKDDVAKKFNINADSLLVFQEEEEICNEHMLSNLLLNDFGIVEIKLKLTDDALLDGKKLETNVYYSSFTLPDIITVHIPMTDDNGETYVKDLVVEIENKAIKKPFLGGFFHKTTKVEYHHAISQTGPTVEQIQKVIEQKCSRDTQTAELCLVATDMTKDQSTQHFGDANETLYFPKKNDLQVNANSEYETHDEAQKRQNIIEKVRLIQRNFRRCRLLSCIKECAEEYRRLMTIKKKREERVKQEYINSNKKSGNFPHTKKDFDVLFSQIATWKENETKRIVEEFTGPTRIVEMQALLEKEIQLLNGIEKRRCEIQQEIQITRQDQILKKCGEPITWSGYNDVTIHMDTLKNQRARKLTELFTLLREPYKLDDRLRLLNDISEALSSENTGRIVELENLFERERQLLRCKVSDDALEILRQRELSVFFDIIKDEERNKYDKASCLICEKCKQIGKANFTIHSKQKSFNVCRKCANMKTAKSVDLSVYHAILRTIMRDERKRGSFSSFAFVIQETDIKHIIENIWHGMSILSQCNVISDLRLPRWNINEEWSPWNCVCLTDTEARIHTKCADLELIYGEKIITECRSRQSLAKSTFNHLKKIDKSFVENGNLLECKSNNNGSAIKLSKH